MYSSLAKGNGLHSFYKITTMVMINDFVIQAAKPQDFMTTIAIAKLWYVQHKFL